MNETVEDRSILLSIIRTSTVHQYVTPLFWGTNAECDAELERRDPDFRHGLKVARVDEMNVYTY